MRKLLLGLTLLQIDFFISFPQRFLSIIQLKIMKCTRKHNAELTPVIAVPVQAQARGSRYHGALAIMKIPKA